MTTRYGQASTPYEGCITRLLAASLIASVIGGGQ